MTLITQIFQLLENQKTDHEPDGLGRASGIAVKISEFFFKPMPENLLGQLKQWIIGIKLVHEVWIEKIFKIFWIDFILILRRPG